MSILSTITAPGRYFGTFWSGLAKNSLRPAAEAGEYGKGVISRFIRLSRERRKPSTTIDPAYCTKIRNRHLAVMAAIFATTCWHLAAGRILVGLTAMIAVLPPAIAAYKYQAAVDKSRGQIWN